MAYSLDRILLATDGSEGAERAADLAAVVAERTGAFVTVLYVAEEGAFEDVPGSEDAMERGRDLVDETGERFDREGVRVETAVRNGEPADVILDHAETQDADLVVVGTSGRTGVERFLLGSVAEEVVRRARVPVLTARGRPDGDAVDSFETILAPTDGSEPAERAFELALAFADAFDASVHVLSVVEPVPGGADTGSGQLADARDENARSAVRSLETRARDAGVAIGETSVEHGAPESSIGDYVEDHGIDLVVLGTHGRAGVERFLLGSVTEEVVRTSPVPVLTVRASGEIE